MMDLAYNLLLVAIEAAMFRFGRGRPAAALAAGGAGALLLGGVLGGGFFGVVRLWAWAIFLHGPAVLAGFAWTLRKTSRRGAAACAALALGAAAVGVDAFWIEPYRLEIGRLRVVSPKLKRPLRIGVLSDFQTDEIGEHETRAVRALMAEKPDLILLPGDFIQAGARQAEVREAARELFRREGLSAPLGVYAVQGNVDPAGWPATFEGLAVTCFERTESRDLDGLRLTGLSFVDGFDVRLRVAPAEAFHVVFAHGPDFALGEVQADLLVAGHTHGGQVRLPFLGPPVTMSRIPRAWAAGGATALEGGRTLVVTRGVGMERGEAPRLRFLCPPELTIIEAVPGGS